MRLSVVVPLYNKARYVRRAVESILAQTFTDFELLVVNDGSTDESAQVVASFADSRLRLIHQANAGPGAARNRGLSEAQGEYTAFLDADDEWLPGYLAWAVQALDNNGAVSATCGHTEGPSYAERTDFWRKRGIKEGIQNVSLDLPTALLVHQIAYMHPCSTVARTSVLRELGGFYDRDRCRYAEDAFLFAQVILRYPVYFGFEPLVRIDRSAAELSNNLNDCRPIEPFLIHPERLENNTPPELRPLLHRFLAARAFKTACVLGYWGEWAEGARLRKRFRIPGSAQLPYFWPSLLCTTPAGAWLGSAHRALKRA